jgi:hypothetical protein
MRLAGRAAYIEKNRKAYEILTKKFKRTNRFGNVFVKTG